MVEAVAQPRVRVIECPDCKGYGEVIMPNSYYGVWDSDPANRYPVMCGLCRGIGEIDEEVEDDE